MQKGSLSDKLTTRWFLGVQAEEPPGTRKLNFEKDISIFFPGFTEMFQVQGYEKELKYLYEVMLNLLISGKLLRLNEIIPESCDTLPPQTGSSSGFEES